MKPETRSLAQQIGNCCKRFTGVMKPCCDAGIKYDDTRDPDKPGMPCFKSGSMSGGKFCDKAEFPTDAEVAAKVDGHKRSFQELVKARKAIVTHLGGPWKQGVAGSAGIIDCPVCGEKESLRFSRAGYNGHIHAGCTTKGCVSWME